MYIYFIFKLKVKIRKKKKSNEVEVVIKKMKNEKLQFTIFIIYYEDYYLHFDKMNYYFYLFIIGSFKVNST